MKKINKMMLVIAAILFMPIVVFADQSYVSYENIKTGGNDSNGLTSDGTKITYNMSNDKSYEFTIVGHDLNEDEDYTITLFSDFKNDSKTVTGAELNLGVKIEGNDGDSTINVKVQDKSNQVIPTYAFDGYLYEVGFYFNDNFNSEVLDKVFNDLAPDGKISLNAVKPEKDDLMETVISYELNQKLADDRFSIFGGCYEGKCSLYISDNSQSSRYKTYEVEYVFVKPNEKVKKEVDKYVKNFDISPEDIENNLFTMDDLETISYKVVSATQPDNMDMINSIINYSSEFQKALGNSNLIAALDIRAGWDDEFTSGGFGFLNLIYDGILYGSAQIAGVKQNNVIYISDDVKDDTNSYIEAATERIKKYLPDVKVSIERAGKIDDLDFEGALITLDKIVDVKKTLGEYYKITLNGNRYLFFIAKDSSKMRTPIVSTQDIKTDITISSTDSSVPLDTKIKVNLFEKNSKENKEFLSKLKLDNGVVVDLKLFSNLANAYIKKLDNGKFKVYIPLTDDLKDKNLSAYFIAEDGKVEEYKITKENGYAVFETKHFSTYTIGKSKNLDVTNPPTYDDINVYVVLTMISVVGLAIVSKKVLVK